jgi:lambda family phage minor tail protein L
MTAIQTVIQDLSPGNLIELFQLDLSFAGGNVLYFIQGAAGTSPVSFGGIEYTPVDIEFDGMEVTGVGALPTPTVRVANAGGLPQGIINTYGDIVGCTLKRIRTFKRFLDDGEEPDSMAIIGPDVFRVERKSSENPVFIEWELSAAVDQQGKRIPGRVVIRDTCLWRYRQHQSGTTFIYPDGDNACPYAGTAYFDEFDQPTTAANDRCSRRLTGCKLRFGQNAPLPFGGFPGVSRSRM